MRILKHMERKHLVLGIIALVILGAGTTYAIWREGGVPPPYESSHDGASAATTTPDVPEPAEEESVTPYGEAGLALNEVGSFPDDLSIRPVAILEDSRCPRNAQCVRAGTVKVSVRIRSAMGVSTNTFEPGTTITTEAESVTLLSVTPEPIAGEEIPHSAYRFLFEVRKRPGAGSPPPPTPQGACYVGGCSSQLCTDDPAAMSTCEFREEYACYRTARCERQTNGSCGWTETSELQACLADPPELDRDREEDE